MAVPQGKRHKSDVEFERLYITVANDVDNLVEHNFFAEEGIIVKNLDFLASRKRSVEELSDRLIYHIRIASSIYPQIAEEFTIRRTHMDKAIGVCYTLLTHYQRVFMRLRVEGVRYVHIVNTVDQMINSLKHWRKSDNRIKNKVNESI